MNAASASEKSVRYDLAVCYRIYPRVSRKPLFGYTDKLAMARDSLATFKQAVGGLRVKLYVLLDNCPPAYTELFQSFFRPEELELISLPGEGNEATFCRQIDVLSAQREADLVYFAEDDYLYLPGALETMVRFMRENADVDFVTAYDHPDNYSRSFHQAAFRERDAAGQHWRTVQSTCLTFMARRAVLEETGKIFRTYQKRNPDAAIWISLTKSRVFNPWAVVRSLADSPFLSASVALAWRHALGQILFGRRYTLWSPLPTLATHMESTCLAPNVDWEKRFPPGHGRT